MMSTQASRRKDAERAARRVTVSDHGATDTIDINAANRGVARGVISWDAGLQGYRIRDPYTWADVDAL